MKMLVKDVYKVAAGVTLIAAVCNPPAIGATLTGTFQVDVTSNSGTPLARSSYYGTYSFDNADSNTGNISPVDGSLKLSFDFVNLSDASISQTYTELSDIFYRDFPKLSLSSGTITGLDYLVATSGGTFSFDGFNFLYSVNDSAANGSGIVKYSVPKSGVSSVPESSPALGLVMLGLWGVIARYRWKNQQNIYRTLP